MFPSESLELVRLHQAEVNSIFERLDEFLTGTLKGEITLPRGELIRSRNELRKMLEDLNRLHLAFQDMHDQRDRHNDIYHK